LTLKTTTFSFIYNLITLKRICLYVSRIARAHVENAYTVRISALAHCKTRCL